MTDEAISTCGGNFSGEMLSPAVKSEEHVTVFWSESVPTRQANEAWHAYHVDGAADLTESPLIVNRPLTLAIPL